MSLKTKAHFAFIALPVITLIYSIFTKQYSIMLNSAFTVFCIGIFIIIHKKFPLLTSGTYYAALIFVLLSVFAGRTLKMYSLVPYWDKFLHFLSGFILAPVGTQIYIRLGGSSKNSRLINLFALLFAIAAAGIWEIYEFFSDSLFGTAAQNNSLPDTMLDMIAGSVSAVIAVFTVRKMKK